MSELSEIKDRLMALESISTERWNNHDERSVERWGRVEKVLNSVDSFMRNTGERRNNCMKESRDYTRTIVSLVIGIPASITAIIGVIALIHSMVR
jgi:hypothetical protein